MPQRGRYLAPLEVEEASHLIGGTWHSNTDEIDIESLILRPDSTFTHSVTSHSIESRCDGTWSLFAVRFLGADADAPISDLEIQLRSVPDSHLLTSRLAVCGSNPRLDGFQGKSCRLLSAATHRKRRRHREKYQGVINKEEQPIPTSEAKLVAEATGRPLDACIAALLSKGNIQEAVAWLLDTPLSSPTVSRPLHSPEGNRHTQLQQVMDICSRTRGECEEALSIHASVEDAIIWLLGQPVADRGQKDDMHQQTCNNSI